MLYQPNFCCHCGECIERLEWKLWTSRRFCENCERAFQSVDWIPKFGVGLAILFGITGFGSYLRRDEKPVNSAYIRSTVSAANNERTAAKERIETTRSNSNSLKTVTGPIDTGNQDSRRSSSDQDITRRPGTLNDLTAPVYFCGAQTKKGTPCTRKVKGSDRCWQHKGQPAMLPKERLIARQ